MPLIHRNLYSKKTSPIVPARSLKSGNLKPTPIGPARSLKNLPPSLSALSSSSDDSDSSSSDCDSGDDLKRTSQQQPLMARLRKRQSSLDLTQFNSDTDFDCNADRLRASSLPGPNHIHNYNNSDNNDYGHFIEFAPPPPRPLDASYAPSAISTSCSSTFSSGSSSMNTSGGVPATCLLPPVIGDLLWPGASGSASAPPPQLRSRSRSPSSHSSTSRPVLQIAVPRLKPNTTKRSIINPTTPLDIPSILCTSNSYDNQTPWVGVGLSQSPPDNVDGLVRVVY